jgi:hypothetical protein
MSKSLAFGRTVCTLTARLKGATVRAFTLIHSTCKEKKDWFRQHLYLFLSMQLNRNKKLVLPAIRVVGSTSSEARAEMGSHMHVGPISALTSEMVEPDCRHNHFSSVIFFSQTGSPFFEDFVARKGLRHMISGVSGVIFAIKLLCCIEGCLTSLHT